MESFIIIIVVFRLREGLLILFSLGIVVYSLNGVLGSVFFWKWGKRYALSFFWNAGRMFMGKKKELTDLAP